MGPIGFSLPLQGLPPYNLGGGNWLTQSPITQPPVGAVKPGQQSHPGGDGEVVTEWVPNDSSVAMHGRTYTYPNTDNGRELLAQQLAARHDEIWATYDPTTRSENDATDWQGAIINIAGTPNQLGHDGSPEKRTMRIWHDVNTNAVIMTEAWCWDGSDEQSWRQQIEQKLWFSPQ